MPETTLSQQGQCYWYDVLVIGGGIAGLSAILTLVKLKPSIRIALLCKQSIDESNSYYAQGGVASVGDLSDDLKNHIADTIAAGDQLCNLEAVNQIISEGPQSIEFLIEQGIFFDQMQKMPLAKEGGHSHRRIYTHGDRTGAAILQVLIDKIKQLPQVNLLEYHTAVNLINSDFKSVPGKKSAVIGAYVLAEQVGIIHTFLANVTLLATGGAGKIYRYTSNPDVATGDGIAMAYRAGARVSNMEFYQFHPTLLYHAEHNNMLISEALRGEGAYLRLVNSKKRFMGDYAPVQMELATRDVVARAIFTEIERSAYQYVFLDITHHPKAFLQLHFPQTYVQLLKLGIDMSKDQIPVVPGAHYLCGGILATVEGVTDLDRLLAIGEVACTGLHGANRLASNSLLEGVVTGRRAAQTSLNWLNKPLSREIQVPPWSSQGVIDLRRASQINAHWRGLRGEMTSYAGIVRTAAGLRDLLHLILLRREMIEDYYHRYSITRDLVELRNILLLAELIVRSALNRCESRGGHYREDFPDKHSITEPSIQINKGVQILHCEQTCSQCKV
ncbi:MAG: L-aspartate oxidase [Proteobacteria bacterium]|nr:L-aspartate oxidase [Pseudomonadota bacterium]